jgi:hypothetical protein
MTDEQAGRFIKAIYQYQKNKELPGLEPLLEMAITPFINQFMRDEFKYHETSEERKLAGSKGGKKRAENAKKRSQRSGSQSDASKSSKCLNSKQNQANEANQADSDSDSDSDSVNDSKRGKKRNIHPTVEDVIAYFKEKGYSEAGARKAHEYYELNDWHDSEGKPVIAWKQKMFNNWLKDEYKVTGAVVKMNGMNEQLKKAANWQPTEEDKW